MYRRSGPVDELTAGPPRVDTSKRLVLINSASSLATWLLSISVLVWLQQYLLRRITPEEYSLLPVVYAVMMFAPLLTTILTGGLGRYVVEAYAKGDDERVTQIVSTMFPILCAAGAVFLAGGWTFSWYIDKVLAIPARYLLEARIMMALLVFSAAVRLPLAPFGVGLFVHQRFVLKNLIELTTELLRLGVLFLLLFYVSTRVLWVVTATVSAEMVNLAVVQYASRRLLPLLRFHLSHVHWPIARELTSFGGWSFVASLADTVRNSADVIILNRFATPLDVTCFYLGSLALRQIQRASVVARGPLSPALTALHVTHDKARLRNVYLRVGRVGMWVVLFIAVPLMVYSGETINLYVGPEYKAAAMVMVLLLSTLLNHGMIMLPQIASATAEIRPFAVRQAAIHSVNLVLTLVFVAVFRMGAVGSALATFLAVWCLETTLLLPLALRMTDCSWAGYLRKTIGPGMLPAVAGSAIWVALERALSPASWLGLGVCAAAGCVCFALVLFGVCLQPEDKEDISRVSMRIAGRLGWGGDPT